MALKHKELLRMTNPELNAKAVELKQELSKERSTVASGTRSEKPGKIRKLRRDIARILTAMSEKKRAEKVPKAAAVKPVEAKKEVKVAKGKKA